MQTPTDGTGLVRLDPWLEPYSDRLRERHRYYTALRAEIDAAGGILGPVSEGHHYFGLNHGERDGEPGTWYREWAPAAEGLSLIGDFNGWDRSAHPLERGEGGVWSLFLPGADPIPHGSLVKVHVRTAEGGLDRIPAYIRRAVQDPETSAFSGQVWAPAEPYRFRNARPDLRGGLRIYEAHVGMAQEEPRVGTYREFTVNVLPRIADLGYNAVQLMAIAEHPYYGSFGYHVSSFFAPSSRFGTPDELKELIDTAHGMGLWVLMDLVHSHAVKNVLEGLNRFDGTDHHYFHGGPRGEHPGWDSRLFDYGKPEVRQFLLSNVRYWLEEFRFDGFRFDGVTSMLYRDHGLGFGFSSYDAYFGPNVDADAVAYLQLANELAHAVNPPAVTIAEDMSGMVGMARPVTEGGIGFDYRLAMGVPDYWIKTLKHRRDEEWNLQEIYHTLLNRRAGEKHVGYAESHDQALVGDKTLAFWLMDQDMYWHMRRGDESLVIDRGLALHKLIRLLTFSLAGEAYLNFIGNEFGHPEWVDFPREGNGYSYQYARRQWSLVDRPDLRYRDLNAFDQALQRLDEAWSVLEDPFIEQLGVLEAERVLVYRRGPLVFAVNLHPTESHSGLRIPVPDPADYRLVLDSDQERFGGHGRVAEDAVYPRQDTPLYGRPHTVQIYLPSRTAQVLAPASEERG